MKTLITALLIVLALSANAQSKLDTLDIAPDLWRGALARLTVQGDTLKCPTTQSRLYRSGRFKNQVIYQVKGKTFEFDEAEILKWCALREEEL